MKERSIVAFAEDVIAEYANGKKIKLSFTGLRPGEKLREALLTAEEVSHTLEIKDMFIILRPPCFYGKFSRSIRVSRSEKLGAISTSHASKWKSHPYIPVAFAALCGL